MSLKKHVIFCIPSLAGGGAERVIVTLLRHLDRTQFLLTLAVVNLQGAVYLDDVPQDVELIDLKCSRVRYALPKLVWLIWKQRPDIVFSTLGHLNLALAIVRPLLPDGVCYIARETSIVSEVLRENFLPQWWRWAYHQCYCRFDTVICQSRYMRDDLIDNFAFPATKAVVIHNPVDIDHIRSLAAENLRTGMERDHDTVVIHLVAAGRMTSVKGFDLLIEALALCADSRLRLTLLGEGPLSEELKALAKLKGVAGQVRFIGFQKNPYPFFAQADAFVLSSRFEGFPNVVLEALACGTPVIATPGAGGTMEILENIEGCVIADSLTAEGLARAFLSFLYGDGVRIAQEMVEQYTVKKIIVQYNQKLTTLLLHN